MKPHTEFKNEEEFKKALREYLEKNLNIPGYRLGKVDFLGDKGSMYERPTLQNIKFIKIAYERVEE